MPRKSEIFIPEKCLKENFEFTESQQRSVISSMLIRINLALMRGNNVFIRVRNFGDVFTHGNRKRAHLKHMAKYNKTAWKKRKEQNDFSEKKLLF